jgi:hypothetical protein
VGTLPDAGKISVPGSDLVRALIRRCGARPATGRRPPHPRHRNKPQSLPNLSS